MESKNGVSSASPDGLLLLRTMTVPANANPNGAVFGGWIMARLDEAGAVLAYEMSRGKVVTIAVDSIIFKHPVNIGDVVCVYGRCIHIGSTSLKYKLQLWTRRNCEEWTNRILVTETTITYVAVDDEGRKRQLPAYLHEKRDEILALGYIE